MTKMKTGFALMSKEQQRAIASMGGKAAFKNGTGHRWNTHTAKLAGQKGGRTAGKGRSKADNFLGKQI